MFAYRLLLTLAAPLLLWKARGQWRERLGLETTRAARPHLWLHAASNGELASARPVIAALQEARPDLPLFVTCNSETGVALAREMGFEARLAPIDLSGPTRRVLSRWRVAAHLTMESELWPNRIRLTRGPVIALGARMTEKSARLWRRLPGTARASLGRIALLSAQEPASLARFRALGLPEQAAGPVTDLKALVSLPDLAPDRMLEEAFRRGRTWLAASTHDGEERIVLDAFRQARKSEPGLRLILAPRHPRRGDEIADLVRGAGLMLARRSTGDAPGQAAVYLADTMGEMVLWYRLAGRVFVGGTMADVGGHTPYEPARFACALIHGPDIGKNAAPFARLHEADAAIRVETAEALAQALRRLSDPARQTEMGEAGRAALAGAADLDALMARLLPLLPET
ncbi:3-deoxy-D-manno-octulosonic acid transferase [Litorisediminicola beolgyonensis]|uniref:3-deoxy-D-manno-octulosonic acid transferase n=1 Tax=Litorisediminicola beolgyonensis TaxID=1173614 RepID=A0ABW3ZLY7_9RHOB